MQVGAWLPPEADSAFPDGTEATHRDASHDTTFFDVGCLYSFNIIRSKTKTFCHRVLCFHSDLVGSTDAVRRAHS
jgi:hypothetical protein